MNQNKLTKELIFFSIFLFLFILSAVFLYQMNFYVKSEINELIKKGKELYKKGEYEKALISFLEALTQAKTREDFAEVYLSLSITYYANAQIDKTKENLQNLFKLYPKALIDERYYPSGFVKFFNQTKIASQEIEEGKRAIIYSTGDIVPLSVVDVVPVVIKKVPPRFNRRYLKRLKINKLIVSVLISENGEVDKALVIGGSNVLDEVIKPVKEAIRQWKFKPAIKNGVRVKVWKPIVVKLDKKVLFHIVWVIN